MSRREPVVPAYRHHRPSGQNVVTLNGVDHYPGPHATEVSKAEYDRITAEWLASGRTLRGPRGGSPDLLFKELVLGYYRHTRATSPDVEAEKVKLALRPVTRLYGQTRAAASHPVAYKAVQSGLVGEGLCISTIWARLGVIKRTVAWGVEDETLPGDALHRLQAVAPLRAGTG